VIHERDELIAGMKKDDPKSDSLDESRDEIGKLSELIRLKNENIKRLMDDNKSNRF